MKYRVVLPVLTALLLTLILMLAGCGATSSLASSSSASSSSANAGGSSAATSGGTSTPVVTPIAPSGSGGTTEFLYAIENPNAASVVETFTISSTGALSALTPTVTAGDNANDIVADPQGKYVVTGNSSGCCSAPTRRTPQLITYTVDGSGNLTVADQQNVPNAGDDTLNGLLLDPTGADLYSADKAVDSEGTISSYSVNRSSGKITLLQPDPLNTIMPGRMSMHPNGIYLYAAIQLRHHYPDFGGFDLFLRDPATGTVTDTHQLYPGSRVGVDFYEDNAIGLSGQYLVAVCQEFQKITVWSIDQATGALKVVFELNGNFQGLTVDRSGKYVIATMTDGTVNSYAINADGSLTPAGSAAAAAGVNNVVVDASNKFVYAENSNAAQIFGFTFDASTGALSSLSGSPFTTSAVPIRMAPAVKK